MPHPVASGELGTDSSLEPPVRPAPAGGSVSAVGSPEKCVCTGVSCICPGKVPRHQLGDTSAKPRTVYGGGVEKEAVGPCYFRKVLSWAYRA